MDDNQLVALMAAILLDSNVDGVGNTEESAILTARNLLSEARTDRRAFYTAGNMWASTRPAIKVPPQNRATSSNSSRP